MDKEKKGIFGNFEIMNYQKIKICFGYSILKTQFKPCNILHLVHIKKKNQSLISYDKLFCGDFIPFGLILNQSTC